MLKATCQLVLKVKRFQIDPDRSDIDLVYFGGFKSSFASTPSHK